MAAFTNAGKGAVNDSIVFFSKELRPTKFPDNINYIRLHDTSISVWWTPLSLFEAQGFPQYQAILSESSTNRDSVITTNNSFGVFTDLSNNLYNYSLVVGVTTGNNESGFVYSNPLTGMLLYVYVSSYHCFIFAYLHTYMHPHVRIILCTNSYYCSYTYRLSFN